MLIHNIHDAIFYVDTAQKYAGKERRETFEARKSNPYLSHITPTLIFPKWTLPGLNMVETLR